jgi:ribosomal protein S18 acetylase RimI-like enzyme
VTAIRPARPEDATALYAICLRTGAGGGDATATYDDLDLLGHLYVGPYLYVEPSVALVLDDGSGPAGYVLGTPDTRTFEAACERDWWPALRRRYPLGAYPDDERDGRLVRMLHAPLSPPDHLVADFPAHLHIDLLPHVQGRGHGRRLMTALLDRLGSAGATGVHLGVGAANTRAIGFYRAMGFTPAGHDDVGGLLMSRRFEPYHHDA